MMGHKAMYGAAAQVKAAAEKIRPCSHTAVELTLQAGAAMAQRLPQFFCALARWPG